MEWQLPGGNWDGAWRGGHHLPPQKSKLAKTFSYVDRCACLSLDEHTVIQRGDRTGLSASSVRAPQRRHTHARSVLGTLLHSSNPAAARFRMPVLMEARVPLAR